jgi:hypothetical protein
VCTGLHRWGVGVLVLDPGVQEVLLLVFKDEEKESYIDPQHMHVSKYTHAKYARPWE